MRSMIMQYLKRIWDRLTGRVKQPDKPEGEPDFASQLMEAMLHNDQVVFRIDTQLVTPQDIRELAACAQELRSILCQPTTIYMVEPDGTRVESTPRQIENAVREWDKIQFTI